jgi:VQ motif
MSAESRENKVKVTFIDTIFVEVDSAKFMSVVQKLTGKEPSKANEEKEMLIESQAQRLVLSTVQAKEEVYDANGGFELEAPCAKDALDEVGALMVELEPHLDELYAIMNQ